MRSTKGSLKPIFISVGHCVSLDTAITIVKMTCKYRVPEPTRQVKSRSVPKLWKFIYAMLFGPFFFNFFNTIDLLLGYRNCNMETLMPCTTTASIT